MANAIMFTLSPCPNLAYRILLIRWKVHFTLFKKNLSPHPLMDLHLPTVDAVASHPHPPGLTLLCS